MYFRNLYTKLVTYQLFSKKTLKDFMNKRLSYFD